MKIIYLLFLTVVCSSAVAQQPSFMIGPERPAPAIPNSEAVPFTIGQNHYVLYRKYRMMEGMVMHLEGFTGPQDKSFCSADLTVPHAPNEVAIYEGFSALSDRMLLFRAVFHKDEKRYVLYAHEVSDKGVVSPDGKEITSIAAEKAMNSGNYTIQASEDGKSFAVLAEQPFQKETKEKISVALYDASQKLLWQKDYEFPYDARKGPENTAVVANSGIVYLLKKITVPKNPDTYSAFVFSDKGSTVREVPLHLDGAMKIVNYGTAVNQQSGDLILAGYYTEDGKVSVSVGGVNFKGRFYFRIAAKDAAIVAHATVPFEHTMSNIRVNSLKLLNAKAFLVGESMYENNVATGATDTRGFPVYNTEYHGGAAYVSLFDENGKEISFSVMEKDNQSTEDSGFGNTCAVGISGSQLVLIYNDFQYKHDGQQHKIVGPGLSGIRIPVIQLFGEDGKPGKEFAMIGTNVGGKEGSVFLYPGISLQLSDKEFFFMSTGGPGTIYPVRMKLP